MLDLKIKPEAERDLSKIFEYTEMGWGMDQAEKYQDDLFTGMLLLTKQEELGKVYLYAKLPYRKLHINRHLIFYRIEGQICVIIRVLHESMDIK
jgi:toxin ParE1/3/4